ncbi:unnamed protein product [Urochloa humidicola]
MPFNMPRLIEIPFVRAPRASCPSLRTFCLDPTIPDRSCAPIRLVELWVAPKARLPAWPRRAGVSFPEPGVMYSDCHRLARVTKAPLGNLAY